MMGDIPSCQYGLSLPETRLVCSPVARNKRKIMRIFTLPPTVGSSPEPNFYDSLQKVRLRQQLEMYSLGEHRRIQVDHPVPLNGKEIRSSK